MDTSEKLEYLAGGSSETPYHRQPEQKQLQPTRPLRRCISCRSWSCPVSARETCAHQMHGSAPSCGAVVGVFRDLVLGPRDRARGHHHPAPGSNLGTMDGFLQESSPHPGAAARRRGKFRDANNQPYRRGGRVAREHVDPAEEDCRPSDHWAGHRMACAPQRGSDSHGGGDGRLRLVT
jgi:hypothetical protein